MNIRTLLCKGELRALNELALAKGDHCTRLKIYDEHQVRKLRVRAATPHQRAGSAGYLDLRRLVHEHYTTKLWGSGAVLWKKSAGSGRNLMSLNDAGVGD